MAFSGTKPLFSWINNQSRGNQQISIFSHKSQPAAYSANRMGISSRMQSHFVAMKCSYEVQRHRQTRETDQDHTQQQLLTFDVRSSKRTMTSTWQLVFFLIVCQMSSPRPVSSFSLGPVGFHRPISTITMIASQQQPRSIQQHGMRNMWSVLGSGMVVAGAGLTGRTGIVHAASTRPLLSDEVKLQLTGEYLGLGLGIEAYKDASKVIVTSVKADAPAECKSVVRPGFVLVSVGGQSVDGMALADVGAAVKQAPRPTTLVFRDPTAFMQTVQGAFAGTVAETAINENEVLRVERVAESGTALKAAACIRPAAAGDVCEVSYSVRVGLGLGLGETVVDGLPEVAPIGAPPSDDSFYFVLGSAGSSAAASGRSTGLAANNGNAEGRCKGRALPPGWDRYSMAGMCVGERRRIVVPPSLAFGAVGLLSGSGSGGSGSSSGSGREAIVPPNTPLVIEVRLLSLNGIE